MDLYIFGLIAHILSAIGFVGYVFFDVCIFPFAKKYIDENTLKNVKKAYTNGGATIFGTMFLTLIVSGIYMSLRYFGGENGYFKTSFQILLFSKIIILILMCLITAISIYFVFGGKKPDPFGKYSHLIALVMCILIVILAKLMWVIEI